ncbi:MAG: hypothetical protein QXR60_01160 [Candidatus Nanoarchaeia archaeon]
MEKRGQLTVFIIIGVVLVIVVALLLYYKTNIFLVNPTAEDLNIRLDDIREHIIRCTGKVGEPPIRQIGLQGGYLSTPPDTYRLYNDSTISYLCYSMPGTPYCVNRMLTRSDMEKQLSAAIDFGLQTCVDVHGFQKFGSFDIITPKKWTVDTRIGSDMVVVTVNYPVRLRSRRSDVEVSAQEFTTTFNYPLGYLYDVSQDILDYETQYGEFDQMIYMLSKRGQVRIEKKKPYPDKLYILSKYDNDYIFQFFVQGESTLVT